MNNERNRKRQMTGGQLKREGRVPDKWIAPGNYSITNAMLTELGTKIKQTGIGSGGGGVLCELVMV